MVSKRKLRLPQVFWDKLAHARFDPGNVYHGPVFPPVTLIKQGLGTRLKVQYAMIIITIIVIAALSTTELKIIETFSMKAIVV